MDAREELDAADRSARKAQALLDNPTLRDALEEMEVGYLRQFRTSGPTDQAAREDAYHKLRAIEQLRVDLESVAGGGAVAAFNNRRNLAVQK